MCCGYLFVFFFQAEDGIRDLVRSRGLGDVYKRQITSCTNTSNPSVLIAAGLVARNALKKGLKSKPWVCLLYTSDAADERSSVDLGGRRIIKKKKQDNTCGHHIVELECTTDDRTMID